MVTVVCFFFLRSKKERSAKEADTISLNLAMKFANFPKILHSTDTPGGKREEQEGRIKTFC